MGCGTGIVVNTDRSLSHSILRDRLGSGIDDMEGGRFLWGEQRKKEKQKEESVCLSETLLEQKWENLYFLR